MQCDYIFKVPIFTTRLDDHETINAQVIEEFLANQDNHTFSHEIHRRYENTYVSIDVVPSVRPIHTLVEESASKICKKKMVIEGPKDWWFNYQKEHDITEIHNHYGDHDPPSELSAVYYLRFPENGGDLMFTRRLQPEGRNFPDVRYHPEDGMLILFPPWLDHYTTPNRSNSERISMAFNIDFAE